jgi:hypothetical protein
LASVVLVILAGATIAGFWVSLMVTVKLQAPLLLLASLTVQLTVVVPFWKVVPLTGVQVTLPTPEQLSLATGVL